MTSADLTRLRLSSPGELIEAVPYLLGFHPRQSLVMVGFHNADERATSRQQVSVVARSDLPQPRAAGHEMNPLVAALRRAGSDSAVVLLHSEHGIDRGLPLADWRDVAADLQRRAAESGIYPIEVLLADDHRWWSLTCRRTDCCPETGTPRQVGYSVAAAQATVAGLVALPERNMLLDQFEGDQATQRAALDPLLARAEHRIVRAAIANNSQKVVRADTAALIKAAREACSVSAVALTRPRLARFGVALGDVSVRDTVWMAIDEGVFDAAPLMGQLFRALPSPYDAAPLFLFGWQQWRAGNGTLASMAAERALDRDRTYTAAALLLRVVETGMDPRTTPRMRRGSGVARQPT